MSLLRQLIKDSSRIATRNNQVAKFRPGANTEKIQKWLQSVNTKATSLESKTYCAQLSSVVQFFNKPAQTENLPTIKWEEWKETLNTEGLVDKVKANYENLIKEEYEVEKVVQQVVNSQSKDFEELDYELGFHRRVWLDNYCDYHYFLFSLEDYGNAKDYMPHEQMDFFSGLESQIEELVETHNYFPGSKDDVNLFGYLSAQFAWGKKVISFYRHPGDDFKSARGTKNILGR